MADPIIEKTIYLPVSQKKAVISARPFTGRDRIAATRMARVGDGDSVFLFATLVQHARMAMLLSIDGRQQVMEDLDEMDERDIQAIEAELKGDPRFPQQEKKADPATAPAVS